MLRLALFGIALVGLAVGCARDTTISDDVSGGGTRVAIPSDDPIMRAIEVHLARGRESRKWDLGPDLTEGGKLPRRSSLEAAVAEAEPYPGSRPRRGIVRKPASTPAAQTPVRATPDLRLTAPLPTGYVLPAPGLPYSIQAGDVVDIAVSGYPELSGSVKVRRDGGIVLPGSGLIVRAAGRTADAFADLAASAMQGKVLKAKPEVSVEVRKGPEYFVFVRTPGGELTTVPASEATTLAALVTYLSKTNGLTVEHTFRISYPMEGGTFSVAVRELLSGKGRGLPLTPGSVVEITGPEKDGEAEEEERPQVSSARERVRQGLALITEE